MSIFITGATGYIGSYVCHRLLTEHREPLALLVRADDLNHAHRRLWQAWQLHFESFAQFADLVSGRVRIWRGDLTAPRLGLDASEYASLVAATSSVIHIAASLNRKSAKACLNVNLRGTLEVIKLARAAQDAHGLRRFSDVSTVAVAGHRSHEVVGEDDAIRWELSDYDPYGRTKKFCEHMVHELLPEVDRLVLRPSTVLGDSRFGETTQFDMVRAFVFLAQLPALPLAPHWRMDIVPADYVGDAIATLHMQKGPTLGAYHLSSGTASNTYREILSALAPERGGRPPFVPWMARPFGQTANLLGSLRSRNAVTYGASLLKVFWPYITYDTVFDNQRVVQALGRAPARFSDYAAGLYRFAVEGGFRYPYAPWPEGVRLDGPGVRSGRGNTGEAEAKGGAKAAKGEAKKAAKSPAQGRKGASTRKTTDAKARKGGSTRKTTDAKARKGGSTRQTTVAKGGSDRLTRESPAARTADEAGRRTRRKAATKKGSGKSTDGPAPKGSRRSKRT